VAATAVAGSGEEVRAAAGWGAAGGGAAAREAVARAAAG